MSSKASQRDGFFNFWNWRSPFFCIGSDIRVGKSSPRFVYSNSRRPRIVWCGESHLGDLEAMQYTFNKCKTPLAFKGQFCRYHQLWEHGFLLPQRVIWAKNNGYPSVVCTGESMFDNENLRDFEITKEMFFHLIKVPFLVKLLVLLSMIP